ncbi:MAG: OB-fold nucleic acid binding domain-containing protein, partial [Bacteroidota bacterium]|nr:OB-fold nucleic acid binding domain-containing protein [Bacteroidota bacterium]MDX5430364.1 OB-fold nucleic acid binding domain-containing protein [Bacteroidota bacterium]MDX5469125.1 OB-fold nucleic acid binding domain-containing protein [Bacteroidota bacterium]
MYIKDLGQFEGQSVTLQGWVANRRDSKGLVFLVLRDGTGMTQCIVDLNNVGEENFENARRMGIESSLKLSGRVVKDERQIGGYEVHVDALEVYQFTENYPIAKKEHGVDFLMDHRHLWLRSQRQWAIMRIRNQITYSIHRFFQQKDFVQMDAPLFTGNACEGTTNLFETDFYGAPAFLSQSGQLYGEAMAMAMGRIYTFGPTFRAEKSKTRRHLSEFWMIEPEMAFYDIFQNMDLIEDFLRFVTQEVLAACKTELEIIGRDTTMLEKVAQPFPRLTYDEAVRIIKGEQDVNGKNSIKTLESDLALVKERMNEVNAEIAEREAKMAAPGMKKGEIAFNQRKVDDLKSELKDLEEDERNIPQWLESARTFE